jgi:hypothetical protein
LKHVQLEGKTMKRFLARLLASLMSGVAGAATEDQWRYPVIKDYGKVRPYPNSTAQPDPAKTYKVLVDIKKGAESVVSDRF